MRKLVLVFLLATCPAVLGQGTPKPFMTLLKETVVVIKLRCQAGQKTYDASGTGFFVLVPDERLGMGKGAGFSYLATNRHVAECWGHLGRPMEVKSVGIRVNLLDGSSEVDFLNDRGNAAWVVPSDQSIDLAVLPLGLKSDKAVSMNISVSDFATDDLFSSGQIHEGQTIIFTGFFPKIEGARKMQPIVREGIIAMLADEPLIEIKKDLPAKFYLGDVHVLAGNSGSPVMVNLGGIQGSSLMGESYRLLGVVSGYLTEEEDMSLKLETTVEATGSANSGITTIVPVGDLRKLLDDERLRAQREAQVAQFKSANPVK